MHFFPSLALYIDPGSGSMVMQLLLGGVSGIYVIFRIFKQKILGWFGIRTAHAGAGQRNSSHPAKEDQAGGSLKRNGSGIAGCGLPSVIAVRFATLMDTSSGTGSGFSA